MTTHPVVPECIYRESMMFNYVGIGIDLAKTSDLLVLFSNVLIGDLFYVIASASVAIS